jgi:DNA-binding CsgD family transcriptional regulator
MYLNLDYIEKAKDYTDLTLEFINPEDIPLYYYNTQGIIQGKAKNFKEAEKTFQTIIEKSKQGSHQMLLAQSYSNYGNLKRKKKEFEAGLKYLSLSDSICKELKVDVGIFYNKINRAELYFDSKKLDKALSEINPLKDFVVDADNPKLKMSVYELLYRIYDDLSQTDLANTYYRLYTENKNMYIGDLPRSVVSEWEVAREREQKLQLSVAYESKLQKQNSNKYWLSTGFLLFVLLSVMAYFIIYKKQLKQKQLYQQERQELQYQVQLKSKELLSTTIKELSIQRVKDDLLSDLNKILDDLPNVHKNKFNLLKQKLIAITSNELLVDFESKLDISFSTFYNKLKDAAPNLSPSELIVCALIKLNYTSKDIALLTNRSVRTIENSRSQIRKKLQLKSNENLQIFILSI